MSRLWARSLRGRVTLVATAVAALVLTPVAVGSVVIARSLVADTVWSDARDTAGRTVTEVRTGGLKPGTTVPLLDPSINLIQVVAPDGTIVAASDAARNRPPLSGVRPPPGAGAVDTATCRSGECLHLTAMRVSGDPGAAVVYAGRRSPSVLATRTLEATVAAQLVALVALAAWATWAVTGWALRPVGAMRAELDEVNVGDLSSRVTQPRGEDEVAQLARAVNGTLARLERSAQQQRQFASDASHELRTPIAGLRAQLESAELYPEETDLQALVKSCLRDTDRLEAIITDLLLLARIGSRVDVAKERTDLAELVRQELSARKDKIPVRAELEEGVAVQGVRLQLVRVLTNLLDNAQRHAESRVRVTVSREDGQAVLAVENDGAQIAEEDRERIFERFTRLDAARSRDAGGTGLGLAIARDVAMAHSGEIRVEDHPEGARFVLRLPAV
ncbi:HAMP domain-containing sensor histidine kinase [Nonomuraea sp. SBT364]|uniref:HAMP domain-containing sensor histidine kinase n=1 Tax=Nonomuraea sp. SBT364 TaxID=1580530 RepID=UPI00066EAFB0|nr:HAMP domain-containing sensor histidine kinase [Nonomuraea sp. SBT364]